MASFAELRRRKVFRAGVGYAIAAFAVLQALSSVSDAIDLAPGTFRLIIIGILAGFPLTLFLAWAYDLGPGGLSRTRESTERGSPRWLELTIIGTLTLVVGGIGYAIYRPDAPGAGAARPAVSDKSIAVLPFVNLSGDASNEYFGDGLAEELLNVLAKLPELRVAARTSSFAYKGRNEDVRRIGNELNVATVLEGSVRKSGDKVRVTVQLINVADGYHLWSQNYDRTLSDIFTIQDEIAAAIADALKVTLLGQTASAATAGTGDVNAYDLYLLGRHNMQSRTEKGLLDAISFFEKALAVDPRFARAWSGLADANNLLIGYGNLTPGKALPRAEAAAIKALELDPNLAEAHASLGLIRTNQSRLVEAEAEFKRALELNPDYAPAHVWYGTLLGTLEFQADRQGKADEATKLRAGKLVHYEKALALDPSLPPAVSNLAGTYDHWGRRREAIGLAERLIRLQPEDASLWEAKIGVALLDLGAPVEAIQAFGRALETDPHNVLAVAMMAQAYLALGDLERAQRWADHAFAMEPGAVDTVNARAIIAVQRRDPAAARAAFAPAFDGRDLAYLPFNLVAVRLAVALVLDLPEAKAYTAEMGKAYGEFLANDQTARFGPWIALAQRRAKQDAAAAKTLAAVVGFVDARTREGFQRADWHYAAAQAHALSGRRSEALAELQRALQRGWNNAWLARNDPTLASLRDDAAFVALLSTIDATLAGSREALSKSPPKDWTPPAPPAAYAMTAAALDGLVGNYAAGDGGNLHEVARRGEGLSIKQGPLPMQLLRAIGPDEFVQAGSSERFRFVRDANGRATHALVRWLGQEQRLKRVEWVVPVAGTADRKKYSDYVGRYEFKTLGFELAIKVEDGKVMGSQAGQPPIEIKPERDDVFFVPGQALRLTFKRDAGGKVIAMTLNQLDADPIDGAKLP
jgi:TolB-like protein/Tfp pilus assembly protein PilF